MQSVSGSWERKVLESVVHVVLLGIDIATRLQPLFLQETIKTLLTLALFLLFLR